MAIAPLNSINRFGIHPQKFALWAALGSITMMFASLTSAYVVRRGAGNWLEYKLPSLFFISTLVLLISSVTLHLSYSAFKKNLEYKYKGFLLLTFLLGIAFAVLQYQGWLTLYSYGIEMKGNPSGSFFYAISGIHLVHVLGGLAALTIALVHAYGLPFLASERRRHRFELVCHYWHFVDILWVYLLSFMIIQQ